jgi:hypothetical protein
MPVSAGTSAHSKRTKQEAGRRAELAGLGTGQGNISVVHRVAKPRPRHGDTKSNKMDLVLKRLRLSKGATIAMLMETTGWQAPLGAWFSIGGGEEEAWSHTGKRGRQGWHPPVSDR